MRTKYIGVLLAAVVLTATYLSIAQEQEPRTYPAAPWVALSRAEKLVGNWRAMEGDGVYILELRADGVAVYRPQGKPVVTFGWEYENDQLRLLRPHPENATQLITDVCSVEAVTPGYLLAHFHGGSGVEWFVPSEKMHLQRMR